ncbi:hypothetical protein K0M31_011737 [Melipona bicolor]|uniref:Uncharacterized protein n=1 Tax=Melipona bicolor TaxID=60889 RepID=A0AA40GAB0_9HYME|nr:hypothetical protein K0M31_011737 [Melipona bicolor]
MRENQEEREEERNDEKGGRKGRPSGLAEFHVASSSRVPFWDEETADKILRFHEWLPVLAHLRPGTPRSRGVTVEKVGTRAKGADEGIRPSCKPLLSNGKTN